MVAQLDYEDIQLLEEKESPCKSCKMFEQHGKECWFYWEHKSECSQRDK